MLILCRTPFQSVIIQRLLHIERVNTYDLVYFTQNNSEEDRYYFGQISTQARFAQYIFIGPHRFDIVNHIHLYYSINRRVKTAHYDSVALSSFDNMAFLKVALRNSNCRIITFDDGTGYINKLSSYVDDTKSRRKAMYKSLARLPTNSEFIKLVDAHYSVYRNHDNIMPKGVIRYVDIFTKLGSENKDVASRRFFIGQPFAEYNDDDYVSKLKAYIRGIKVDFYVMHPRESMPVIDGVPILPKLGRIAEEAIVLASGGGRPMIFGAFSSVLINISADIADKVMILRSNVDVDLYYAELGTKAGCQIVFV